MCVPILRIVIGPPDLRKTASDRCGSPTDLGQEVQLWQDLERRKAEQVLDRFFTLSRDLFCVGGFDGYFKRVNPAWERTLGYTSAESGRRGQFVA